MILERQENRVTLVEAIPRWTIPASMTLETAFFRQWLLSVIELPAQERACNPSFLIKYRISWMGKVYPLTHVLGHMYTASPVPHLTTEDGESWVFSLKTRIRPRLSLQLNQLARYLVEAANRRPDGFIEEHKAIQYVLMENKAQYPPPFVSTLYHHNKKGANN